MFFLYIFCIVQNHSMDLPNPEEYAEKFAIAVRDRLQQTVIGPTGGVSGFPLEDIPADVSMFRKNLFLPHAANIEFPSRKILHQGNFIVNHRPARNCQVYPACTIPASVDNYGNFLIGSVYIIRNTIAYSESTLKLVKVVGVGTLSDVFTINGSSYVPGATKSTQHVCVCGKPCESGCVGNPNASCCTSSNHSHHPCSIKGNGTNQWQCKEPLPHYVGGVTSANLKWNHHVSKETEAVRNAAVKFLEFLQEPLDDGMRDFEQTIRSLGEPTDIPEISETSLKRPLPNPEDPSAALALRDVCENLRDEFSKMISENGHLREEVTQLRKIILEKSQEHEDQIHELEEKYKNEISLLEKDHAATLTTINHEHSQELAKVQSEQKVKLAELEKVVSGDLCVGKRCYELMKKYRQGIATDEHILLKEKDFMLAQSQEQIASQKKILEKMRKETGALSSELTEVKVELKSTRKKNKKIRKESEETEEHLQDQIAHMESQIDSMKTAIKNMTSDDSKETSAIISDLHKTISELEECIETEKTKTSSEKTRADLAESKLKKFRELL